MPSSPGDQSPEYAHPRQPGTTPSHQFPQANGRTVTTGLRRDPAGDAASPPKACRSISRSQHEFLLLPSLAIAAAGLLQSAAASRAEEKTPDAPGIAVAVGEEKEKEKEREKKREDELVPDRDDRELELEIVKNLRTR